MIPKGYEDFVSSSEELLKQYADLAQAERDEATCSLYILDQLNDTADFVDRLTLIRQRALEYLKADIDNYLWNSSKFDLYLAISPSAIPCLRAVVQYGNNLEDEWYTVYLLQKLSKAIPNIAICIRDNDGEFLLIEASDHIDSWLSPDNAENRVWIMHGELCCIPLETPGRLPNGGIKLSNAIDYLRGEDVRRFGSRAMKAINDRTLHVYPAKAFAHEHFQACLLPKWAEILLNINPCLISFAIRAFADVDHSELSKLVSKVKPSYNVDNAYTLLIASSVRMTRTMYAELTFKKFNTPRRFHYLMRKASAGQSAKVMKAFELGCRIVCGLLLAYEDQKRKYVDCMEAMKKNSENVVKYLDKVRHCSGKGTAKKESVGREVVWTADEESARSLIEQGDLSVYRAFEELLQKDDMRDLVEKDEFEKIVKAKVRSDSDAWLYLDPDQLDKEMQERMAQFSLQPQDIEAYEKAETAEAEEERVEKKKRAEKEGEEEKQSAEELQEIVDKFKSFLSEESDYTGIQTRTANNKEESSEGLDVGYIEDLVSRTMREAEREEAESVDSDDVIENENDDNNYDNGDDEEDESEDENEEDEGEHYEEGDMGEGEDEEEEDEGENYEMEMDSELLQEHALRSTFEDILQMRKGMGDGEDVGPMNMSEQDIDTHLLMNLLQSHAEGLGAPGGPAQALLAQLGLSLPRPPPMHAQPKKGK